jgi:hypothetical protein
MEMKVMMLIIALFATTAHAAGPDNPRNPPPPVTYIQDIEHANTIAERCQLAGMAVAAIAIARDDGQQGSEATRAAAYLIGARIGTPAYALLVKLTRPVYKLRDMTPHDLGVMVRASCVAGAQDGFAVDLGSIR